MNSNLSLLQSFVSEQFICIKKTLEEIIDLYQRNENTSTYTTALIKKTDDLKEENKMKNRTIKSLFEHNNAVLWQRKDQIVAIENTPSKNVIVSNFEETVSAHIILAETPNVKEDMKEILQTYQRTIHQKMLMTFLFTVSKQSIGTPSQMTITVFQTIFQLAFQIISS